MGKNVYVVKIKSEKLMWGIFLKILDLKKYEWLYDLKIYYLDLFMMKIN